jgi:rhodanese-related sulfurtransferase
MKIKHFIPIGIALFFSFLPMYAQSVREVTSKEVSAMVQKDKKLIILDVRTVEEFNSGHIKGAINIDIRQPNALSNIDKLDHNAKYIVHCRTNRRSKNAVDYMVQQKFITVYQMMDGMNGWVQNNLPLVK